MSSGIVRNAAVGVGLTAGLSGGIAAGTGHNTLARDITLAVGFEGVEAAAKLKATNIIAKEMKLQNLTPLRNIATARGLMAKAVLKVASPVSFVLQILPVLLDSFWDPFSNYNNKILADMKIKYDSSIKEILIENGFSYPLELKPVILKVDENGGLVFDEELIKYMDIYFRENKLYLEDPDNVVYDNLKKLKTERALQLAYNADINGLYNILNVNNIAQKNLLIAVILLKRKQRQRQLEEEAEQIKLQYMLTIILIVFIIYTLVFVL